MLQKRLTLSLLHESSFDNADMVRELSISILERGIFLSVWKSTMSTSVIAFDRASRLSVSHVERGIDGMQLLYISCLI